VVLRVLRVPYDPRLNKLSPVKKYSRVNNSKLVIIV
jgi:hypothetical protein